MTTAVKIKEPFVRNFDLSVVIPFYKKMEEFRRVFPLNRKYLERNGIEVVIVLDAPDEHEELLGYIAQYPFVNWRVVMNDKPHEWRNPAKPMNVGLRHATKKYVMVCSPESEMLTDVIYILRKTFDDYPSFPHYAIGRVCFVGEEDVDEATFDRYASIPFGSIMMEKRHAELIGGYDETFSEWGGDDNNIRARLDMSGVRELYASGAMMVHRELKGGAKTTRRRTPFEKTPNDALRHFFFPELPRANDESWGRDFDKIVYDWRNNGFAERQLADYAESSFTDYRIKPGYNKRGYSALLLVQSYNEASRIEGFLAHASGLFDGIILLDDGSTDATYELAESDKLIVKAKKRRTEFNDLENRNILLDMASLVRHDIAFFMDVDERLDERFCDVRQYATDQMADAYMIPYIHLWNDELHYNAEYPSSLQGLCLRYKMIRNIGHSRIFSDRGKLHFHQAPTVARTGIATALLIKHYGLLTESLREAKYGFYQKEDTERSQGSYEHFRSESPGLKSVSLLTQSEIERLTNNFIKRNI